ncbi:ABC transporter ATP-binding protein [Nocardia panacis]|uniref:ABC transporter ATP-binding protein n=2 Tax=Nocardia panacis TaxID=2340916 RepID=A0A3A4KNB2_9NOCA|nr:ABC transporter ATP-binding protein [Nocardia panacis]
MRDLFRPYRFGVVATLLLGLLDVAVEMSRPLLIAAVIDSGIPAAARHDYVPMRWYVALYLLSSLATAGLTWAFTVVANRIGQDVLLDLRHRIFRHVQQLSISFHESYPSGRIISRLTSDIEALRTLLEESIEGLFRAFLSVFAIAIVLLWLDPLLTSIIVIAFLPALWITRQFRKRAHYHSERTQSAIARVIAHFVETVNGIRVVQTYRMEKSNERTMRTLNAAHRDATIAAGNAMASSTALVNFLGNASVALVLLVGGWQIIHGGLALGVLTAFVLYLRKFYDPVTDLARFANSYAVALAAFDKIAGVLAERPQLAQPAAPKPLRTNRAEVEFRDVAFRYQTSPGLVLDDLNLRIAPGETVALVGATGSGKSTIAKLLARFYDPVAGAVVINEIDLREVTDADLRRTVAMVTQEPFLFTGSVADNIALGKPEATRAEIERAAATIGAHEFISELPDRFDSEVNKRGARLSAGQRQLIALTRALLADPAVLILDEATSSMDPSTERVVQRALRTVLLDRTALIIAHRLSTVLNADRVLVIEDGRIVEQGPPEELIAGGRHFAALHRAWLSSTIV